MTIHPSEIRREAIHAKMMRCIAMATVQRQRSREVGNHCAWQDYEILENLRSRWFAGKGTQVRDAYDFTLNA